MKYFTRKMVTHKDLNANATLFGGRVLDWIDEEAYIYCACQLDNSRIVTASMSNVEFVSTAVRGDIVEVGVGIVCFGRTSITVKCVVRNKKTKQVITKIDKMVFVNLGDDGKPTPHGKVISNEAN
jgi:acyl-CoA thioesterase YciA